MIYRLGDIEVDTSNFRLSENGSTIAVEPQVFDLIVYLIANRDRLVTREELFDNLWTGRVVSDTSLSNHIKSARKALGDDGKKQLVIKTIHGRGYQFIANTHEVIENTETLKTKEIALSNPAEKSIAVLAFADLSPEQDQEYFSDGLSEELINLLAKVPELRVISRSSSFSFKGKNKTAEEMGKLLNVTHILEGSVRKAGNHLRITTQLIQVSDESHLWSETFNEELDDVFRIQDDIAQAVIKQLRLTLLGDLTKTKVVDPDAYTLFLEAKYLNQQHTRESNLKAEKIINESIAIDPNYAPAWELLGTIIFAAATTYVREPLREGLGRTTEAINKAIELDPEYAPAYASLAMLNIGDLEFENANSNTKKALMLDGGNSEVLSIAANVASHSGRMSEALDLLDQAIKLDPLRYVLYLNLGIQYIMMNQLDEAAAAIKKFNYYQPEAAIQHYALTNLLIRQGRIDEALIEAEKEPDAFWRLLAKNLATFAAGKQEEADALLTRFIDEYGDEAEPNVAHLFAARNEPDQAFEWLDIAFQKHDPSITEVINYPDLSNLWNEPRWDKFLVKLRLPKDHWLIDVNN